MRCNTDTAVAATVSILLLSCCGSVFAGTKNVELQEFCSIGVEDSKVSNSEITASSTDHGSASSARLNYASTWYPSDTHVDFWLQVWPSHIWTYHRVATQGVDTSPVRFVQKYQLAFYNGGQWIKYTENGAVREFDGNSDANTVVVNNLVEPATSPGIRFYATCCAGVVDYSLRVEAYGIMADLAYVDVGTAYGGYIHPNSFVADSGTTHYLRIGQYNSWNPDVSEGSNISIDLGTQYFLHGYKLEGYSSSDYVTKFQIYVLTDSAEWRCYTVDGVCQNFTSDTHSTSYGVFSEVIEARHITVVPVEWEGSVKMRFGLHGRKKVIAPAITLTDDAYSASSNIYTDTYAKAVYLSPTYDYWCWESDSSNETEWAQIEFPTVYDLLTVKYRGKYSSYTSQGAKYFQILTSFNGEDFECIKEPGMASCKIYYNSENGGVASENMLLDSQSFVTAKYVRFKQVTPINPDEPEMCVVWDFTGYPVPETCVEAQIRYSFPNSGWYWLDMDGTGSSHSPMRVQCDMSTIPAATLLNHDQEDQWLHSKGHWLHIENTDTIEYDVDIAEVEKIVENSVSCELPFEAHGRGVSLSSAYWRQDADGWNANSFRNLEDDPIPTEQQSFPNTTYNLTEHIAHMWSFTPPEADIPGRNGFPNAAIKIGDSFYKNYTLKQSDNGSNGSFTIFMIIKLYAGESDMSSSIFRSVRSGGDELDILHGPHQSQITVRMAANNSQWQMSTPMYSVPLGPWFSLAVSYNSDTGKLVIIRDYKQVQSQGTQANLEFSISSDTYLGQPGADGQQVRMDIGDVVVHLLMPIDEDSCNTLLSLIDNSESFGRVESIRDCSDLVGVAGKTSGVYRIHPFRVPEGLYVYCDLETAGEGWTVVYRRSSAELDFNHLWDGYRHGFGSVDEDYFLGLEYIHRLTTSNLYEVMFDVTGYDDVLQTATYSHLMLFDEEQDYGVNIGTKTAGSLVDAVTISAGVWNKYAKFTTQDRGFKQSCLVGGTWTTYANYFEHCFHVNMFGKYISGADGCEISKTCTAHDHLYWGNSNYRTPAKSIVMKLRRISDPESHALMVSLNLPERALVGDTYPDYHAGHDHLGTKYAQPVVCHTSPATNCAFAAQISGSNVVPGAWLQIDLGQTYLVTSLASQCRYGSQFQCWRTFELYFSYQGRKFTCYGENGNCQTLDMDHGETTATKYEFKLTTLDLSLVLPSRYIRLVPLTFYGRPSIRLEVYVKSPTSTDLPTRCAEGRTDGVYTIYPPQLNTTVPVYCESGWTVIMRRTGVDSNFAAATLNDYVDGINTEAMNGDFWLGLENLHQLTRYQPQDMVIELTDSNNQTRIATYLAVRILSIKDNYAIRGVEAEVNSSISAGNSLSMTNKGFTERCGEFWWWPLDGSCESRLTGAYPSHQSSDEVGFQTGIIWKTFNFTNSSNNVITSVLVKMQPTAERYAGSNLPTYAYSGSYKADPLCHAHNGQLYSDGLLGTKAWCAPTAAVSDSYYFQIDLKNQFYIEWIITQGLTSGQVTQFKLLLSQSGYIYACYSETNSSQECSLLNVDTSDDLDLLSTHQIFHQHPVRYVRIQPTAFSVYPKLRVEFMLTSDTSHRDTWKQKWFHMYGGLIDSTRRRAHPVTKLHIGSTGNPFNIVEYRIPGPLRCYSSYKTCAQVKQAGLPSGMYRLDPDGVGEDSVPFLVECRTDDSEATMGSIYHDKTEMTAVANQIQSLHYGEGTTSSYKDSTEHIEELISLSGWNEQYMRYETGHTSSSETSSAWRWRGQGTTSDNVYRPNSIQSHYCSCEPIGSCAGTTKDCNTFDTSVDTAEVDEGYLIGVSSSIPLPVTQWKPNTNGGKAFFGPIDIYFDDPDGYIIMSTSSSLDYDDAVDSCASDGYVLATFEQLYAANINGFDSLCYYGWVQEGMAYALFRPRVISTSSWCIGDDATVGVHMRTKWDTTTGKAFCYTGDAKLRNTADVESSVYPVTPTIGYTDYSLVDYCASSPCRSRATCVNDKVHLYYCICVAETDQTEHCTQGLKSCGEYQSMYNSSSGYYYIDPDGADSGEDPYEVYCDMSRAPPLTILENNAVGGFSFTNLAGKWGQYSVEVDVGYKEGLSDQQLDTLIKSSSFCHQVVEYYCYNSGTTNARYTYGTTSTTRIDGWQFHCDCYPDCDPSDKKCNCYEKETEYKNDTITMTNRDELPIRTFFVGNVDEETEFNHVKVSHLSCITDKYFSSCYHYKYAGYTDSGHYTFADGSTQYCNMSLGYIGPACPDGFINREGTLDCYYVHSHNLNQWDAMDNCAEKSAGAHLAILGSDEEQTFVNTLLQSSWMYRIGMLYVGNNAALNKWTSQKSEAWSGPSYLGVDGSIATGSRVHSADEQSSGFWWWMVDLGTEINATGIKMTNRLECCGFRTNDFYIMNSLTSTGSPDPDLDEWEILIDHPETLGDSEEWTISKTLKRVGVYFHSVDAAVNWCELEIFYVAPYVGYQWFDGTTQDDYAVWGSNYPSSSELPCVVHGQAHKMRDHNCHSADKPSICEENVANETQVQVETSVDEYATPILSAINFNDSEPIDEVQGDGMCLSNPCLNNGTCTDGNLFTQDYQCQCLEGFMGTNCEIPRVCPFDPFPNDVNITLVMDTGERHWIQNSSTLIDGIPASSYNYSVSSYFEYACIESTLIQGSLKKTCGTDLQWSGIPPKCKVLHSCIDYRMHCYPSGLYDLDFDGPDGSLAAVKAYCDMSTVPPTTIIHTTTPCDNKVQGFSNAKSYSMNIAYGIADEHIDALILDSFSCSQQIEYDCYKSPLNGSYAWVGKDDSTQYTYLDSGTRHCSCYNDMQCARGEDSCNCDYDDYVWRQDAGYITEKDKLPIRRVYYGGQKSPLSLGFHKVGPLKCQQAYATCADYKSYGYTESFAWIDPDGLGGMPAVYVKCDYESETITFAHDYPHTEPYNPHGYGYHYADPLSWSETVDYSPNSVSTIHTFLSAVKSVTQIVTYVCRNSFLYYDGVQYGGWADAGAQLQESFAGTPDNGQGCACGNDSSCTNGSVCNCADSFYHWGYMNDSSIISNATLLPITALYMGGLLYEHSSYYRFGLMFLSYLTAEVNNVAASPSDKDCSGNASICTGRWTCLAGVSTCGCDMVNDADMLVNPLLSQCNAKDPCSTSAPCQNSGVCHWDPWSDERFSCACAGSFGGLLCDEAGISNGGWSAWGSWGTCEGVCGNGTQARTKSCNNPPPTNSSYTCGGSAMESQVCDTGNPCPVDGQWSVWQEWTDCNVTCGQGFRWRERNCSDPAPQYAGNECVGNASNSTEMEMCNVPTQCPIHGGWSVWGNRSECTATCNNGTVTRERTCDDPKPRFDGDYCVGSPNETTRCFIIPCPIHGNWSEWSPWSDCSVTCENGTQVRNRSCTNPEPMHGGDNCTDMNVTLSWQGCHNAIMCPVNGSWTNWTEWSTCSDSCGVNCIIPCGNGTTQRYRNCSSPLFGGFNCMGEDMENVTCALPINCKSCGID